MDEEITRGDEPGALEGRRRPALVGGHYHVRSQQQHAPASKHTAKQPAHRLSSHPPPLFSLSLHRYLPTQDDEQRNAITRRFWEYNALCRAKLWPKFGCHQHWAKIEIPESEEELERMRARLRERFPLEELYSAKRRLDPKGVLGNELIDTLLLPEDVMWRRRMAAAAIAAPASAPVPASAPHETFGASGARTKGVHVGA